MSELVDKLQEAYMKEMESLYNYHLLSYWLGGFDGGDVSEDLGSDVDEELSHADELAQRLKVHDSHAVPSVDVDYEQHYLTPPENPTDVREVVEGVIEAEKDAISTYEELYEVAEEHDDYPTMDLAQDLLEDEQEHLSEFEDYLEDL